MENSNTFECPEITWTTIIKDDLTTLPELNKVCFIKFSDGTTSISSLRKTKKLDGNGLPKVAWVTHYRDDIVAWRYYNGGFAINGTYV